MLLNARYGLSDGTRVVRLIASQNYDLVKIEIPFCLSAQIESVEKLMQPYDSVPISLAVPLYLE